MLSLGGLSSSILVAWLRRKEFIKPQEKMTDSAFIKLDQFLKHVGVVQTGGHAKLLIQDGEVKVNGTVETRRGRKLIEGDRVALLGETYEVNLSNL
jgi:ribosome-associated protein